MTKKYCEICKFTTLTWESHEKTEFHQLRAKNEAQAEVIEKLREVFRVLSNIELSKNDDEFAKGYNHAVSLLKEAAIATLKETEQE